MQFKYLISALFAIAATSVSATARDDSGSTAQIKSYIVSWESDTPRRVVDEAIKKMKSMGASVTHEYEFIKAFAVTTTANIIEEVSLMNTMYKPNIEEDQVISINDKA